MTIAFYIQICFVNSITGRLRYLDLDTGALDTFCTIFYPDCITCAIFSEI